MRKIIKINIKLIYKIHWTDLRNSRIGLFRWEIDEFWGRLTNNKKRSTSSRY